VLPFQERKSSVSSIRSRYASVLCAVLAGAATHALGTAASFSVARAAQAEEKTADDKPPDATDKDTTEDIDQKKSETGSWGVGGTDEEEEGRFGPPRKKKKGKLDELEADEKDRREEVEGPPDLPPPGFAALDVAVGFGDFNHSAAPAKPTVIDPAVASYVIGLGYRIGDTWLVGARVGFAAAGTNGPIEETDSGRDRDRFKQIAMGGIELGVKPHFILSRKLRLPIGLAVVFPSQQGDMNPEPDERVDLARALVNTAASASRGWEDRALFSHHRVAFVPSGGLLFRTPLGPGKLDAGTEMKWEVMVGVGQNDALTAEQLGKPPGDATLPEVRDVAVNWVWGLSGFYEFFDGLLAPGVRLWLAVGTAADASEAIDPGGAQAVFEPGLRTHLPFNSAKTVGIDAKIAYMIPLRGELGGSTNSASVGALRIATGMFFAF
jgi:hypothetical protein